MITSSEELELISVVNFDHANQSIQRFASHVGELLLISDYTLSSSDKAQHILDRCLGVYPVLEKHSEHDELLEFKGIFLVKEENEPSTNVESEESSDFYFIRSLHVYPEGGFLRDLAFGVRAMGWYFKLMIMRDIAKSIFFLHENDIVHNNIQMNMFAFNSEWRCQCCDLISAMKVDDIFTMNSCTNILGDPSYYAPELLSQDSCSGASDVYSFGLLIVELCCRKSIFAGRERDGNWDAYDVSGVLELLPSDIPQSLVALIEQTLNPEAEYRPTAEDVLGWIESLLLETEITDDDQTPPIPPLPYPMRSSRRRSVAIGNHIPIIDQTKAAEARDMVKNISENTNKNERFSIKRISVVLFCPHFLMHCIVGQESDQSLLLGSLDETTIIATPSTTKFENKMEGYLQIKVRDSLSVRCHVRLYMY